MKSIPIHAWIFEKKPGEAFFSEVYTEKLGEQMLSFVLETVGSRWEEEGTCPDDMLVKIVITFGDDAAPISELKRRGWTEEAVFRALSSPDMGAEYPGKWKGKVSRLSNGDFSAHIDGKARKVPAMEVMYLFAAMSSGFWRETSSITNAAPGRPWPAEQVNALFRYAAFGEA